MNFFRSLSPIAWIPFAIIWFGVGDPPAIFIDLNDLVDRRFIPADIQPAMIDATR